MQDPERRLVGVEAFLQTRPLWRAHDRRAACISNGRDATAVDQVGHQLKSVVGPIRVPKIGRDPLSGNRLTPLPEAARVPVDAVGGHGRPLLTDMCRLEGGGVQYDLVGGALGDDDRTGRRNCVEIVASDGTMPIAVPAPGEKRLV